MGTSEEAKTDSEKKRRFGRRYFVRNLRDHIRTDKRAFIVYSVLRVLVILALVRSIILGSWESAMLCVLSLVLFLIPSFAETRFDIEIPTGFEIAIYIFIYAAEILGEVNHYYVLLPGWDTMLHTINGFLCAAIGFSLVDLLNKHSDGMRLSPRYLALVAFCFSMTVGVMWEFVEFSVDSLFFADMQKDFVVQKFGSVTLDPTGSQHSVVVDNITSTVINTANDETYTIEGGYLDIGIIDTMKDLFVNFVGAVVFCVLGYLYASGKVRGRMAKSLLISRWGKTPVAEETHREEEAKILAEDTTLPQVGEPSKVECRADEAAGASRSAAAASGQVCETPPQ